MSQRRTSRQRAQVEQRFASYANLTRSLLPGVVGICMLDGTLESCGHWGSLDSHCARSWLHKLKWHAGTRVAPVAYALTDGDTLIALPMSHSTGKLVGVLCVRVAASRSAHLKPDPATAALSQLRPMMDCLHRELATDDAAAAKSRQAEDQTEELEWLFELSNELKGASADHRVLEQLVAAATARLDSGVGLLLLPEDHVQIQLELPAAASQALNAACAQTQDHLLKWAQRQRRPLIVNKPSRAAGNSAPCKLLAIPVLRSNGRVAGVLAFFNASTAPDYGKRQFFLARHLGRQVTQLLEAQFDLMTGLYGRRAFEQLCDSKLAKTGAAACSLLYLDIDSLHVVNELHGFEIGDEALLRTADLLHAPNVPQNAVAARVSGDGFAVMIPDCDAQKARDIAQSIQSAMRHLRFGPESVAVELTASFGIGTLIDVPQGTAHAISAAEMACKAAKKRGRGGIEAYKCDDSTIVRRRDDVVAVAQLREALRSDRLCLYAQRIAPLRNLSLAGGYELLLRHQNPDGTTSPPGDIIAAAQRYRLLTSIDEWVINRAFELLTPYRGMLASRGLTMSINVSGESMGDERFVTEIIDRLRTSRIGPANIVIEITEQTAVGSIAKAAQMTQRLRQAGCGVALDDFGVGANSLAYLKGLRVSRVKIDGSFVKDLLTNRQSLATVEAIVRLVRGMNIDIVAEYVESLNLAQKLAALGVDYAQGYAYGKPVALDQLLRDLQTEDSRERRSLSLQI